MRTPRLLISFFFLLQGGFSFSQPYELFTINTDTTFNTRFDRLGERMIKAIFSGEIKALKEDLRTEVDPAGIKKALTVTELRENESLSLDSVSVTVGDGPQNVYAFRTEQGGYYISPVVLGHETVWISFTELKKAFKEAEEFSYVTDLFLKKKTRVSYAKFVRIDQDPEMENGFSGLHREIHRGIMEGMLAAYADPQFRFELTMSQVKARSNVQLPVKPRGEDVVLDPGPIATEKVPTHYKYLYDWAWNNGKLSKDTDFPIAFAPVVVLWDGYYLLECADCIDVLYWVRTAHMNYLLPQWKKNMILDWEKGNTSSYVVDRFSVSYCSSEKSPDSLWMNYMVRKVAESVLDGTLNAYMDVDFVRQYTRSQLRNVLNGDEPDKYDETGTPPNLFGGGNRWSLLGLDEYHYRADDHYFDMLGQPLGLALHQSEYYHFPYSIYIYLPELKGIYGKAVHDSIIQFFQRHILVKYVKGVIKGSVFVELGSGAELELQNLPRVLWKEGDTLQLTCQWLYNYRDNAEAKNKVYVISVGKRALPPHKQLIPYSAWGTAPMMFGLRGVQGYCDENGTVRIPLRYHATHPFSEDRGMVYNTSHANVKPGYIKHCGFIDPSGREVVPLIYEEARSFSGKLAAVKKGGKWGYIDQAGKEKVNFQFDFAGDFNGDLGVVSLNGKYSLINRKGKPVGKARFDTITSFVENVALVRTGSRWGAIDKKGRVILDTVHQFVSVPRGGRILAIDYSGENYIYNTSGRKVAVVPGIGLISVFGNLLLQKQDSQGVWKYHLFDYEKKRTVSANYDQVGEFSDGMLAVKKRHLWGFIDSTGKEVIPCQYETVYIFSEGSALVMKKEMNFGNDQFARPRPFFIDKSGKEIKNIQLDAVSRQSLDEAHVFRNGLLKVRLWNGQEGYISRDGREYIYH